MTDQNTMSTMLKAAVARRLGVTPDNPVAPAGMDYGQAMGAPVGPQRLPLLPKPVLNGNI